MVNLWHAIRQTDEIQTATSTILKLIDKKRSLENYINFIDNKLKLMLDRSVQLESELHMHEDEISELEQERDYLDARLADFERLAEEFVQFKAPDHMCRMRFIHLLNMGKWRQR